MRTSRAVVHGSEPPRLGQPPGNELVESSLELATVVLVDREALSLEDPVTRHWPEFGQAGKERITVRQLLSHQAGVVALRDPQPTEAIFDDNPCT